MTNNTEERNEVERNAGEVTALHDFIAGGVAGSASVIVGHPFDTIKVRLQTSSASSQNAMKASSRNNNYASFLSLFKGMSAPLSAAAAVNAIIFSTYGASTRTWENYFEHGRHDDAGVHGIMTGEGAVFIDRDEADMSGLRSGEGESLLSHSPPGASVDKGTAAGSDKSGLKAFACGAAAGTVQAVVICPMEHVKCRLQVQKRSAGVGTPQQQRQPQQQLYKGPLHACTSIVKKYGVFSGLFRGMGVTFWRETPAFGLYFATYDTIKDRVESLLEEKHDTHPIPSHFHTWAASALAGGISGAWTWAVIYPFDVIKSQIQTSPLEKHLQKGMWTVASDIVRDHGWRHMFRGLGVTLARAFPVNAIIFPVYELTLVQLGDAEW